MDIFDFTPDRESEEYPPLTLLRIPTRITERDPGAFSALLRAIPIRSFMIDEIPKQFSVAFGSITEPIRKYTPASESATSKPDPPTPPSTLMAKPTKVDVRGLSTLAHRTTSPTLNVNARPGPSSPSQNNVIGLRGVKLSNGVGGGVGVDGRPSPTSRVPDSSLLTPILQEALNASITSGRFVDTKIYLFSHRNSAGDICKPKVLYANSIVLKSVPYFNDLFSGSYSESATKDLDEAVAEEDEIAEHYDYYSDSDLEDAEDLGTTGGLDDNVTTDDRPQDTIWYFLASLFFSHLRFGGDGDDIPVPCEDRMGEGRVIRVQDVAFVTFQAFLLYLYTGRIEFAPFGSKDNRKTRATEIVSLTPDRVPRPSPKSIYRLADKYDVPVLKFLALNKIREGLERCDPVRETFSRFASYYPEILGMHVENLASILAGVDSGEVRDQLDERLQAFSEGEIDHASDAFSSLWIKLAQNGDGETPCGTCPSVPSRTPSPTESPPLSVALIKSMRQGLFCDRKYMAKREDTGKWRSPVYISSIVLGDIELALGAQGGEEGTEVDCDSDSDYEDTMEGTTSSVWEDTRSRSGEEPEHGTAATLPSGAFSTWRTLFFYLYTGHIQFAPLKSNGIEARARYVRENLKPENPPLCSPKSVCYLAGKLGLLHLETTALGDATAKTSVANIVRETFSQSTARLPRLREVQCQLLLSSTENREIAQATEEYIHGLAGSQTSHGYATLSLGFRMAIEAKRMTSSGAEAPPDSPAPAIQTPSERENLDMPQGTRNRRERPAICTPINTGTVPQPGPVPLCTNSGCPRRGEPLRVRGVGRRNVCQGCGWRP